MALTQRLELKQGQSLVMTPLLQQSIKLLQLSNVELTAFVEAELEKNPLLERAPVPDEQFPDAMEPNGLAEPGHAPQETPLPDGFGGEAEPDGDTDPDGEPTALRSDGMRYRCSGRPLCLHSFLHWQAAD